MNEEFVRHCRVLEESLNNGLSRQLVGMKNQQVFPYDKIRLVFIKEVSIEIPKRLIFYFGTSNNLISVNTSLGNN